MEGKPGELTLQMVRAFRAPPSLVFATVTDPDRIPSWFGPRGFSMPSIEFAARVGESYRFEMQPPDGDSFYIGGEVRDIETPARLAYTFVYEEPDPDDVETLVTMSFRAVGEETEVDLTQAAFKTEDRRALHHEGWTDTFDR